MSGRVAAPTVTAPSRTGIRRSRLVHRSPVRNSRAGGVNGEGAMQSNAKTVTSTTVAEISRRDALKGAASFAAIAASSVSLGHPTPAEAQTAAAANPYAAPANTGPSSVTVPAIGTTPAAPGTPYIMPTAPGWTSTSLLTTGNAIKGYRTAGIPDGLGA